MSSEVLAALFVEVLEGDTGEDNRSGVASARVNSTTQIILDLIVLGSRVYISVAP